MVLMDICYLAVDMDWCVNPTEAVISHSDIRLRMPYINDAWRTAQPERSCRHYWNRANIVAISAVDPANAPENQRRWLLKKGKDPACWLAQRLLLLETISITMLITALATRDYIVPIRPWGYDFLGWASRWRTHRSILPQNFRSSFLDICTHSAFLTWAVTITTQNLR